MENFVKYGFYFAICILTIILIFLIRKGKKEILLKTAMIAVEKVAEHFIMLDNSHKLEQAVNLTYDMLPKWFRLIVKKKQVIWIVEEAYQMTKEYIKKKLIKTEKMANELALTAVGKTIDKAINFSHEGDYNLCNNEQLRTLNLEAKEKINTIWGEMKYKTDFRDNKELMAELGFKRNF